MFITPKPIQKYSDITFENSKIRKVTLLALYTDKDYYQRP